MPCAKLYFVCPMLQIKSFSFEMYQQVRTIWLSAGLELNRSDELPELLKSLERDPDLFVVAIDDGVLRGAVLARYDGRRGYIYHLAVDPAHQRQSIGTRIMNEVMDRLKQKGCSKINLHVAVNNRRVMRFYQRLGFCSSELIYMSRWVEPDSIDSA